MNPISSSSVTRREFLGAVSVAGVTLGFGLPHDAHAASTGKIPIGLELYTLREECKKNLSGMLAANSPSG